MAAITAKMVKELRTATGAGPLDCKNALVENDGDIQKAIDFLREKGLAKAAKKLGKDRSMNEGVIEIYQHFSKRIGVIVEVNCETDFVAATDTFQRFAKDISMHIATMVPAYINREDVPEADIAHEKEVQLRILKEDEKNAKKPDNILEKIIEGRMDKWYQDMVLMEQEFFKDDSKKISDLLQETVLELGEKMQVSRFSRFELGKSGDDGTGEDE